jgi:hypothetical protein
MMPADPIRQAIDWGNTGPAKSDDGTSRNNTLTPILPILVTPRAVALTDRNEISKATSVRLYTDTGPLGVTKGPGGGHVSGDRARFEADFSFVCEQVSSFFSSGSIQRALDAIDEIGITGWEKWWQVEFAIWLSEHEDIGDWVMEEVFLTDLRRKTEKDNIAIDMGFRMKGYSTDEMLFLELKQNDDWRRCIENMLKDVEKVETAQERSVDGKVKIRNFFVVGVYRNIDVSKKEVHDYIEHRAEEEDIPIEREHIFTKFIPNTPFGLTVF